MFRTYLCIISNKEISRYALYGCATSGEISWRCLRQDKFHILTMACNVKHTEVKYIFSPGRKTFIRTDFVQTASKFNITFPRFFFFYYIKFYIIK